MSFPIPRRRFLSLLTTTNMTTTTTTNTTSLPFTLSIPRHMRIGGGTSTKDLGPLLANNLNVKRPCIVTDPFQVTSAGAVQRIGDGLKSYVESFGVFSEVDPDPTSASVDKCLQFIRNGRYDSIIALGGGSPMDTAKAAGVLAIHGGQMRDYKAPKQFDKPSLPLICIPTTAGTGSECTRFTIVTDSETQEKMLCVGLAFLPTAAIVDYELTMTMPYRLTADTGIDAFCHAMESIVSKRANTFSTTVGLKAIERIANNLRLACEQPTSSKAREEMMLAATEAGLAFSNASVTLIHGMSRPIGALYHVPHGLSNAMLAPQVTEFSIPGAVDRYALVAKAAGFASFTDGVEDAAQKMISGLNSLTKDLKVPSLSSWKGLNKPIFESMVDRMARDALASGSPNNNPIVPTHDQITTLYRKIFNDGG
jgi:alcohol dehydrogenase class IV